MSVNQILTLFTKHVFSCCNYFTKMVHVQSNVLRNAFSACVLACVFDRRALLQLQHDGPHAGHVLGVFGRFGIEVAELWHALPFWNEKIKIFKCSVVCYCKLNNTPDCDEHLFGQVSTCTVLWASYSSWRHQCGKPTLPASAIFTGALLLYDILVVDNDLYLH